LALALSIGFSLENLSVEGYDRSSIALRTAKSGRLIKSAVRGDFPMYLSPLVEMVDSEYRYTEKAKNRCLFQKANILSPHWIPIQQQYDLILCRNLLIYLDKASQNNLLTKLKGLLSPHGHLILATAEMPLLSNLNSLPHFVHPEIKKHKGDKKKSARGLSSSDNKKPARVAKESTHSATTNTSSVTCEDACEQLLRYLDENPQSGRAMSELGFLLSSLNKTELAILALERALTLDGSLEEARILVETLKQAARNEL
jgi:tetratricopeptide (TPR) repeat protein